MEYIELIKGLKVSRIIHGHWMMNEWNLSSRARLSFLKEVTALGISTFDHADIYGNYSCEQLMGECLKLDPAFRNEIQIISKCGIKLLSDRFPRRKVKHYDYSYRYIISSVEQSLLNLNTDYLDVLLFHRPSPLFDAEEAARALEELHRSGKIRAAGLSNFLPGQWQLFEKSLTIPLVSNQIEISVLEHEHFDNGNIDFLQMKGIHPMAWSPLAHGRLFHDYDPQATQTRQILQQIAFEKNLEEFETVAFAWLLHHPSGILPITGSSNIQHIENVVKALDVKLNTEDWFRIYSTARGLEVP